MPCVLRITFNVWKGNFDAHIQYNCHRDSSGGVGGEFDALIVYQAGIGLISSVAIGTATNKRINPHWFPKFITSPRIFIRMDEDQAGQGTSEKIAGLSQATQCIQVPQGKDVNDFYLLSGHEIVRDWINAIIDGDVKS